MFGTRILLLIPHPDDEIVAASAAIERAKASGAEVFALYLTHGCIAAETLWPWDRKNYAKHVARRRAEAEEAARVLGLQPIGWAERPARSLWRDLETVFHEIEAAVEKYRITQVWTPAYEGGNADHDGANACGFALAQRKISVLEFAEYNFFQGRPHSQIFPFPNGSETVLMLSPEERTRKETALRIYRSEKGNLNYVRTEREAFRPIAAYDYAKPPHEGVLWYARFQWVPFKHPRVDFTNPMDVCAAMTRFLASR
jgi:LmbE family N-acetylglucosaminyl deacetylase